MVAQIVSDDLDNAVDEARAAVERLDAAIVENDDVAVEKSLAVQAAEFVESMNNTVEAAKAQMEASSKRAEYAETKLGARSSCTRPAPRRKMNWTERICSTGRASSGSARIR